MKKSRYLLFSISIALCFFGTIFTLIRVFYYGTAPALNEYIFPVVMGTTFGTGIGLWRFQTNVYNEKLKNVMEALRVSNDKLQQKNRELVATNNELIEAHTQLRHSQKMEIIGTIAGGVAHDLNNILCGLVGFPDLLLLRIKNDSPLRDSILKLKKSGEKATAIVQDLLTLSRRAVITEVALNLNTLVREYLNSPEFDSLMAFHPGLQLVTNFEPEIDNIIGSPIHLSKTIMNLVSNAAEARKSAGKVVITTKNVCVDRPLISYSGTIKEGSYAVLEISDNGTGISTEDMDKIFEPFFSKKKMGRSGTGLGMAVVWGTIKDHNAYIDVKSVKGEETTFTLYFPMTTKEISKDKTLLPNEDYTGKGETILVVDDVKEQRDIASEILEELGYKVNLAASGEEAIDYFKRNSADLMLLDMVMDPGLDGLETYQKILASHPRQKAIIISGFSETDRVRKAIELGAGQYIRKPYTIQGIGSALRAEFGNNL